MRKRYYLYQRKGTFYAILTDPATGAMLTARTTGTATREDALLVVADWMRDGIPAARAAAGRRSVGLAFDLQAILTAIRK